MTKGIIVSPANRGVQVVVTDENNVQLLIDSNRGVNLSVVPQPRIEVLVDKGVEGAQGPVGPQGPQGPQGTAATVTAGTTTTGAAGTNAIVTNSGTSSAAIFDFTIPRGNTGATGATGAGVAIGGTTGQVLVKASNVNYDTTWATITGTLVYQGSWNASTNTPTLTSSVGTNGYYYVVGTSGSTNLNGITDWVVGDWAIFNGSVWQKIDNTDLVSSVNGQTGVVVLTASSVGALAIANNLSDLANAGTARTNLGLGTIATQNASSVAITGGTESGVTHSGDTIGTYLDYTGTSAPSYVEGRTWYDSNRHAFAYYNDSPNDVVHIGQDLIVKVINNTGSTIPNGSPVYITSTSSGQIYPNVALARADVSATASVIGLTNGAIANGAIGYVTSQGGIDNVNTSTFTIGQVLYLSPYSAGQLMNTIPPTGITVQVGVVQYVNSSTGVIYVKQTTPLSVPASIITGTLPIANGGTGATTASGARTNLGLGTIATQDANNVAITGGSITGITDLAVADGGTGASTLTGYVKGSGTTPLTASATIPSSDITGLGTIASQNANNVAITGGAINNTTVGATTPAAGTFTTLTASGSSYLGGSSTQRTVQVDQAASGATTFTQFTKNTGINEQQVIAANTANLGLIATGGGTINFYTASNNTQKQLVVAAISTAVNYVQVAGSATGGGVVVSAQGSDTDIPLVVQPKGTGALQAQATTSSATGGNARGANAVDWQTSRSTASMVASGTASVLVGGQNNTSSSYASFLGGGANSYAQASNCFIGAGNANLINLAGQYAAIVAGNGNTAQGYANFIGGGFTNSGTSGSVVTSQSGTMNGTTAVTLSGSNASIKVGQLVSGTSIASETYVAAISGTSLTLSKVASGSSTSTLSFYTPHGVVVGGGNNQATGSYSFIGGGGDAGTAGNRNVASGDRSVVVGGVKNTASGEGSFVGGGGSYSGGTVFPNTASGNVAVVVGGINNTSSALGSFIGGGYNNISNSTHSVVMGGVAGTTRGIVANHVFAASSNPISGTIGVSQTALLVLGRETTNATATVLTSDNGSATTNNQIILPNNSAYYFKGSVIANVTGGGNTKGWTIEGAIKRGANAASTALVGTPTVMSGYADVGAATWAITATADTTNGGLAITFTGQAGTTIRVVAKLETTEVTF